MTAAEARTGRGFLQVNVVNIENNFPVQNAKISVSRTDAPLRPLEQADTDRSGQTPEISLEAPPVEYSLDPESGIRPYAEYNLEITAPGFKTVRIDGTEILADSVAIQPVRMEPETDPAAVKPVVIPDHTLYGSYPPKIAEPEIQPVGESGEIVLSRVVVPQTIVVHDGVPTDTSASDYYVPYRDYIKNVASSEISPPGLRRPLLPMYWLL